MMIFIQCTLFVKIPFITNYAVRVHSDNHSAVPDCGHQLIRIAVHLHLGALARHRSRQDL